MKKRRAANVPAAAAFPLRTVIADGLGQGLAGMTGTSKRTPCPRRSLPVPGTHCLSILHKTVPGISTGRPSKAVNPPLKRRATRGKAPAALADDRVQRLLMPGNERVKALSLSNLPHREPGTAAPGTLDFPPQKQHVRFRKPDLMGLAVQWADMICFPAAEPIRKKNRRSAFAGKQPARDAKTRSRNDPPGKVRSPSSRGERPGILFSCLGTSGYGKIWELQRMTGFQENQNADCKRGRGKCWSTVKSSAGRGAT